MTSQTSSIKLKPCLNMIDLQRKKILSILDAYNPADPVEEKDVEVIRSLVKKYSNIFERSCLKAHMTGSALVCNPVQGTVLLHNHKKLNRWLQFGGHADGETNLAKVALKEAEEETGLSDLKFFESSTLETLIPIDIEVQTIPENKGVPQHLHLDFRYLLITAAVEIPTPDETESQELKFFTQSELSNSGIQVDPALQRLINKAFQQLNKKYND